MNRTILPGATIGVLGSGQLGRMFAIAARRMGYRVHTFSPDSDTPTGQVSDYEYNASYDDLEAVSSFAKGVSIVTFEFENVPTATVEAASQYAPVRPSGMVLHTTQHRLREKKFLSKAGFPVVPYRHICSIEDLQRAVEEIGYPSVLKTAGFGYDGKGQSKIRVKEDIVIAYETLGGQEAVLEAFIDFECEVSVVAARSLYGDFAHYGVIKNEHHNHILDVSVSPATLAPEIIKQAIDISCSLLETIDVVGVMCVEFFVTKQGKLLINELAPRPHNSGHFTFDACLTSQFEQQLRAVCGLPLGSTELLKPAAMANLLGEIWQAGEPNWMAAYRFPNVKVHVYGKLEARRGRKMGHLTALADSSSEAEQLVRIARNKLEERN
ncbi:MAG: 5-(carboxyamino)imidazole ribonucleotide synthase [Blastocatellia bacterium]|nr:5-(carboxyamino)imidazole ribonucleotide synthase [Blastocatellia bacterium]